MAQLKTNDLRVLVLMLDQNLDILKRPDDELLFIVQHEMLHLHMQGKFREFYETMPTDIAIRFMTDHRTVKWLVDNAAAFLEGGGLMRPTLAVRLEKAIEADVWADTVQKSTVRDIKNDMLEAATLLRRHGLDR